MPLSTALREMASEWWPFVADLSPRLRELAARADRLEDELQALQDENDNLREKLCGRGRPASVIPLLRVVR